MDGTLYKFGEFCLDPQRRRLLFRDRVVSLSSRAFEMLLLLVRRQGEVVEKAEILERVWADSFVEESNLVVHISALRRILGQQRGERKFIETVSGRGYSFVFPVERVGAGGPPASRGQMHQRIPPHEKDLTGAGVSLAVLPLANRTGQAELEYLATGVTQSLISNLSQLPSLKVMSYNAVEAYRAAAVDAAEIGFLLGVEYLLLGSLTEVQNRLEIGVELVRAATREHLWGTDYRCELTDLFEVRREISLVIAEKLQIPLGRLAPETPARRQTESTEAYRFYLKGMYLLSSNSTSKFREESLQAALKCFRRALRRDPDYALAYTGIGYVFYRLFNINAVSREKAWRECRTALQLALDFDSGLSEALILDGLIRHFFERDPAQAEKSFTRAIEADPNNPIAYHYKSLILCCFEKCDESLYYQTRAIQLDPISIFLNTGLARRFYLGGEYHKAIVQAEETLELDDQLVAPYFIVALSYAELGLHDVALASLEKALAIQESEELRLAEAYLHARAGEREKARATAERVLLASHPQQIDYTDAATVYAALGEEDRAFELLEKSYAKGDTNILLLRCDPRLKALRADARFADLRARLNLD